MFHLILPLLSDSEGHLFFETVYTENKTTTTTKKEQKNPPKVTRNKIFAKQHVLLCFSLKEIELFVRFNW